MCVCVYTLVNCEFNSFARFSLIKVTPTDNAGRIYIYIYIFASAALAPSFFAAHEKNIARIYRKENERTIAISVRRGNRERERLFSRVHGDQPNKRHLMARFIPSLSPLAGSFIRRNWRYRVLRVALHCFQKR